uniref:Uncharacterized protein n=1 Tax=Anguilla anguilla TaxID=7936 RepID=A0A0E9W6F0_ANGAN
MLHRASFFYVYFVLRFFFCFFLPTYSISTLCYCAQLQDL